MLHHHRDNAIRERGHGEYKQDNHAETAAIRAAIPTVVIARAGGYKPVGSIAARSAAVILFFCLVV